MVNLEKRNERIQRWLNPPIEFRDEAAKERYQASIKRFVDAVTMKVPDRVPVIIMGAFLVPSLYGLSPKKAMYDYAAVRDAFKKFLDEYDPDYALSPASVGSGRLLDLIQLRQYKWPGNGLADNVGYQFVEGCYMRPEEYPWLMSDPSDFWIRGFLPRACGIFEFMKDLVPFTDLWEIVNYGGFFAMLGTENVEAGFERLVKAGKEALKWVEYIRDFSFYAMCNGYPFVVGGITKAPFDILADTLRGTKEIFLDLYRRPDLVMEVARKLTPLAIAQGVRGADRSGIPVVSIPLHKGSDEFLGNAQFEKFYWPSLKNLIEGLLAEGCIPHLFIEGSYDKKLEYLGELPKGSCFLHFEKTDIKKAKKEIGDKLCIGGGVPAILLMEGAPHEVKEYCKDLIKFCGEGGGFVLAPAVALDAARGENIRAMLEAAKE